MKAFRTGLFATLGVVVAIVLIAVVVTTMTGGSRTNGANQTVTTPTPSGSWFPVAHFTIQGQQNTESFAVSSRWRFTWKNCGNDPDLTPYYAAGPDTGHNIGSAGGSPDGVQNLYNQPGRYYLDVLALHTVCDITVEDFR